MNDIIYSFIIPHKNSLELLQRCIDSIPQRDDIQIIVVDDNSDEALVDWDKFKIKNDKRVELVRTTEGKGAGYARNIGLKKATGKWILFTDADDFYRDGFLNTLDEYKEKDIDVLYFGFTGILDNGEYTLHRRYNKTAVYYDNYDNTMLALDRIKYRITVPWNKMVRKEFVCKYNIYFEEVPKGNDVLFSFMVGYFAKHISVSKQKLYFWTFQNNSISNKRLTRQAAEVIVNTIYHANSFYSYIGYAKWSQSIIRSVVSKIVYNGFISGYLLIKAYIKCIHCDKKFYIEQISKEIIKK
ncbi:MAG: glycosyltransferase family 2 protein [Bacteroidales bacterium]